MEKQISRVNETARRSFEGARKGVFRCLFEGDEFLAASVFDPDTRAYSDFKDTEKLSSHVADCDILLGIESPADLDRLDIPVAGTQLIDLSYPTKDPRLHSHNVPFEVSLQLIVRSTVRAPWALGDAAGIAWHIRVGRRWRAYQRLHVDLRVLWRFFEYGSRHDYVLLNRKRRCEHIPVKWNVGHAPLVHDVCVEAAETDQPVDIAWNLAVAWDDPWKRLFRAHVLEVHADDRAVIKDRYLRRPLLLDLHEFFAVRLAPTDYDQTER